MFYNEYLNNIIGGINMWQQNDLIMDDESKRLISFFKKLNVIFLILSIITSLFVSYAVSSTVQKNKDLTEDFTYLYSEDEEEEEDYYSETDKQSDYDGWTFFLTASFAIFASIFNYNLILILLKHFSNVAEMKEIKKLQHRRE